VTGVQSTFDELGTPLSEVTFVIVDLETTGGSPASSAITEIGAVKVRGGELLGEFQTLVNPGMSVPPFIAVLTGITESMVATAPRLSAVLPMFLDWAAGSVLVAHNALSCVPEQRRSDSTGPASHRSTPRGWLDAC
jgi:DNA polymerase-3 subunit epsilon